MRVSFVLLALVFVIGFGGFLYLSISREAHEIYVADRDLPAYHQIVEADLRRTTVTAMPVNAIQSREVLLGRYTLVSIAQDEPYSREALGPVLRQGALDNLGLVAFQSSAETSLAGNLARGDRVDVLLSATDASATQTSARLAGVLVVDVRQTDNAKFALILAVSSDDQKVLLMGLGTSRLIVVRTRVYARP